jgi:hypothetical protein
MTDERTGVPDDDNGKREASSDYEHVREFMHDVYRAISTDKPKVVIVVSDADDDPESMAFTLMFDPPFDHHDESNNPDVFGVGAAFLQFIQQKMEGA